MIRVAACAAFIVLASNGTAAKADWQYTRWGMTPAQVAAASGGKVLAGVGRPGDRVDGQEVGAIGSYTSGVFKFEAVFYFVGGRLADIRLNLIAGDRYALKSSLDGVYGRPFRESGGGLSIVTYHDVKKNNRVDLFTIGELSTLEYRPLVDRSAAGL